MRPEDLGYNKELEDFRNKQGLNSFDAARVIAEHKERYIVKNEKHEYEAEITGNLRNTASSRSDFPAVGDWVAISVFNESNAIIHKIFPRTTILERQAVGKYGDKQIIATNIDYAFITQSVDRDFNINRLERYLTLCYSARITPIIVLSKTDLINQTEKKDILAEVKDRIKSVPVVAVSSIITDGYEELLSLIEKGKTYCFLGSSGVGKSTIINTIAGKDYMKTNSISKSTKKGKHTTSHRELIVLETSGILIDNPGMREVGITDSDSGIENTFDNIISLSVKCRFRDCTHMHEDGCAVLEAVENGELDRASYENYLKMERERSHFQLSLIEKREKDRKFGKMVKNIMKKKKENEE